jgi:hypothetical protein
MFGVNTAFVERAIRARKARSRSQRPTGNALLEGRFAGLPQSCCSLTGKIKEAGSRQEVAQEREEAA